MYVKWRLTRFFKKKKSKKIRVRDRTTKPDDGITGGLQIC